MQHSRLDTASVPALHSPDRRQRFRNWLGGIRLFLQRGDETKVSNGSGIEPAQAVVSYDGEAVPVERSATDLLFNQKLADRWKATENEAGRPEGRVVPALVLGEQRYPDPSVWGPDTETPLMEDEDYRAALAYLSSLDGGSESK